MLGTGKRLFDKGTLPIQKSNLPDPDLLYCVEKIWSGRRIILIKGQYNTSERDGIIGVNNALADSATVHECSTG
jgi:hypothetical protein